MAFKEIVSTSSSQRIPSEPYDFENKGDVLEGTLVEKATLKSKSTGKEFKKYTVKHEDGSHSSTLGSHQLDKALEQVSEGTLIRITFGGMKKLDGGRKVKLFKVEADDSSLSA